MRAAQVIVALGISAGFASFAVHAQPATGAQDVSAGAAPGVPTAPVGVGAPAGEAAGKVDQAGGGAAGGAPGAASGAASNTPSTAGGAAGAAAGGAGQAAGGGANSASGLRTTLSPSTTRQTPKTDFGAVLNQGAQKNLVAVPATPAPRPVLPTVPVQPIIVPKPVIQTQPAQREPVPVVRGAPTPVIRR